MLAGQISAAVVRSDDYERARARAEALAEIDRVKTAFFSNVSHEFRTPLTLMLGPLEDALAEPAAFPKEHRQRLDVAHRNALRILRLVNSLLDFSRIESGRVLASYRPTDLAALTADLAASFRSATDKAGLRLIVDTPSLSEPVYVDREMWEKVVLNLVSNAFKFTFQGEIAVELREAGREASLTVRDTGTGIPPAELHKLFERFHRVESARGRSFEGSGIGLALVRELVQLHGGRISVVSELDRGSAFTVSIPLGSSHLPADRVELHADDATPTVRAHTYVEEALHWLPAGVAEDLLDSGRTQDVPQHMAHTVGAAPSSGDVLVADDNADLRAYIARLLTERGYQVAIAPDGKAALEAIRRSRPDLVVTDVMMPRLDGFGLLRRDSRESGLRDLPVVARSAREGRRQGRGARGRRRGLSREALFSPLSPCADRGQYRARRLRREPAEAIRSSEAVAREQAERVKLALDAGAIIGTWVWDIRNDRLTADERFARSFNLSPEECRAGLPAAKTMELIHEEDRPHVERTNADTLLSGGAYRSEYPCASSRQLPLGRGERAGGNGPRRRAAPMSRIALTPPSAGYRDCFARNERGPGSPRQRVNSGTRAGGRGAAPSAKNGSLGEAHGGIAHDFNNLLTIVIGNVVRRAALFATAKPRASCARTITKDAESASEDPTTARVFAPSTSRAAGYISSLAPEWRLLDRALGEIVQLEAVKTAGLWKVEADPNQFEAVILNLAVNARDAMPEGGKLTIETANVRLDEQYAGAHPRWRPAVTSSSPSPTQDME